MGWLGLFSCTVHFGVTICPVDIHFWVISELYGNKPGQKIKNIILPHIFPQKCKKLKEIYNLLKKGVSGLPYLKISTWKFCETCAKLKHLGPLVMWNCQISQDRESPQKWTVLGLLIDLLACKVSPLERSIFMGQNPELTSGLPCMWVFVKCLP